MTKFPELFAALAAPFEEREVKTRPAQGGRQLHYITARTAMNRLDSVLGPENWWDEYVPSENSVLCKLTLRLPDGSTVTKADAGGYAGMADSGDDDKSGFSDAFKRACAKWGLGRYLYRDGVPQYVGEPSDHRPPESKVESAPPPQRRDPVPNGNGHGNGNGRSIPRSGKAMFAWLKEMEQQSERPLVKKANEYGKKKGFPEKIIDWTPEQVAVVVAKVQDLLSRAEDEPEAEPEHRPSESKVTSSDSIAIAKGDPLGALKAEIVQSVMQLEYARLGRTATSREVMDRIECNAAALANGETFETVGGCRDRPWLLAIAAELKREVEALRAFERESKGGAA